MKRRMLDGGIWANEKFAELPCMARLLQVGLVTLADDQGRMKGHPAYLRSQLFPYDDVAVSDISDWLERIMANGTIVIYETGGKFYIQLVNWWEYQSLQYASPSEHPRPDGWQDRIRYNAKGNMTLTSNWITVGGEPLVDTCDQDGNPLPIVATLPPRNPGGRPPKNPPENPPEFPPENVNKEEIKINTTEVKEREAAPPALPELPAKQPTPQQELFGAICEAIGWDYHIISDKNKGQVAQTAKILATNNYTVEDIRRFMVEIWFKDWRWEKSKSYPTLAQLREEIGKLRSLVPAAAPPPKAKGPESWKRLAANLGATA